jgi:hypothetical protein
VLPERGRCTFAAGEPAHSDCHLDDERRPRKRPTGRYLRKPGAIRRCRGKRPLSAATDNKIHAAHEAVSSHQTDVVAKRALVVRRGRGSLWRQRRFSVSGPSYLTSREQEVCMPPAGCAGSTTKIAGHTTPAVRASSWTGSPHAWQIRRGRTRRGSLADWRSRVTLGRPRAFRSPRYEEKQLTGRANKWGNPTPATVTQPPQIRCPSMLSPLLQPPTKLLEDPTASLNIAKNTPAAAAIPNAAIDPSATTPWLSFSGESPPAK